MRDSRRFLLVTACTLGCLGLGALAPARGANSLTSAARKVMQQASQSNIAEIEEGQLALTHSKDPQVQALGNRLVQDHSKAENALEALAASTGLRLPAKPNAKQQQQIAQLGGLQGASFDKLFAASEVSAHRQAITQLDRAAATVKNSALEAWIKQSIPVLEEHLQLAQNLPSQLAMTRAAQAAAASPR
jgi:putative membrane protein